MGRLRRIRGVITPIFTPYTDAGTVDEEVLGGHVDWLIERGIRGIMPCGTTGEGALLTLEERKQVVERVIDVVNRRIPILAHVGAPSTGVTIDLARHARACGADAVSVVTPYYFRLPGRALVEHFCAVAEAVSDTSVVLYNIPQCTGNALSRPMVEAILARSDNVIGIKDSSGDLETLLSFTSLKSGTFQVVCGSDGLLLQGLRGGACASVSGNSNVFPEVLVALIASFERGEKVAAQRQQRLLDGIRDALLDGRSISLMKRALSARAPFGGPVRSPLPEASRDLIAEAQHKLEHGPLSSHLE